MASASPQSRTYAAAHFALELDGKDQVGLFRSIEGGSIKADVMTYQNGANRDRWRQLGKPKFEDIKLQVGMSMSRQFYTWIDEFVDGVGTRKNGAIVAADFTYTERARREFTEAMIKELTFPKLDATDKNPAYMNVTMAVESLKFLPGGGRKLNPPAGMEKQRLWTACNFRFRLDGFGDSCRRVSKVDSFTIKQNVAEYHGGGMRGPIKCPTRMDFPQLSFYVPEADAQPFMDHFMDRYGLRNGTVTVPGRLNGMIEALDNELNPLFTVAFHGADICNVQPDKSDSGSEDIKQVKVDLYTESMDFTFVG